MTAYITATTYETQGPDEQAFRCKRVLQTIEDELRACNYSNRALVNERVFWVSQLFQACRSERRCRIEYFGKGWTP